MFKKIKVLYTILLCCLLMLAVACSQQSAPKAPAAEGSKQEGTKPEAESNVPVELTIWLNGTYPHDEYMNVFGQFIVAKYPNVSFQVLSSGTKTTIADMVTTGVKIDLLQTSNPSQIFDAGLEDDITDLIKKHNFDLNTFDPAVLALFKQIGGDKVYGFPNTIATSALFYNKDIFDKFGVTYPKNGMVWDEAFELAKQLTRLDNGVQYQGFVPYTSHVIQTSPLNPGVVDPQTLKAKLDHPNWRMVLENFARFHQIPGNPFINSPANAATKEKRVAMFASQLAGTGMKNLTREGLNWGIVSMPEYPSHPGIGPGTTIPIFYVAKGSPNREWAFKVAAFLGSAEFQRQSAEKNGGNTSLRDKSVLATYAQDVPEIPRDKNVVQAMPKTFATPFVATLYDSLAFSELLTAFRQVVNGEKDVNSALREAEERANKAIEAAKLK